MFTLGPGTIPGYALLNAGARFQLKSKIDLLAQINNVFDRRYNTAAQLGPTGLTGDATFIARPLPAIGGAFPVQHATFYAPGAPRTFWAGLRVKL